MRPVRPHEHPVAFYDSDAELVTLLADHVATGLRLGESVVLVATPAHLAALEQVLAQRGLLVAALPPEQYLALDAAGTLAGLLVDGHPDRQRFRDVLLPLLDARTAAGRPVRAFGEMVALLWDRGESEAALELEALWNELGQDRSFLLLCAYGTSALAGSLAAVAGVCRSHSQLLAPGSYRSGVVMLGRPAEHGRCETFVPLPEAIPVARRFVTCTLRAWCRDDLLPDVQLVVTELATNAVVHALSPFQVAVTHAGSTVRIAVADVGEAQPVPGTAAADAIGGRGLALVHSLASRWGVDAGGVGKVVWAEFDGALVA